MLYKHVKTLGLALAMLGLASALAFANDGPVPTSTGVVATITAIDAQRGLATLKTEAGEVFELPKGWRWKVGDRVACDWIADGLRPRLQACRPW